MSLKVRNVSHDKVLILNKASLSLEHCFSEDLVLQKKLYDISLNPISSGSLELQPKELINLISAKIFLTAKELEAAFQNQDKTATIDDPVINHLFRDEINI